MYKLKTKANTDSKQFEKFPQNILQSFKDLRIKTLGMFVLNKNFKIKDFFKTSH